MKKLNISKTERCFQNVSFGTTWTSAWQSKTILLVSTQALLKARKFFEAHTGLLQTHICAVETCQLQKTMLRDGADIIDFKNCAKGVRKDQNMFISAQNCFEWEQQRSDMGTTTSWYGHNNATISQDLCDDSDSIVFEDHAEGVRYDTTVFIPAPNFFQWAQERSDMGTKELQAGYTILYKNISINTKRWFAT